MTLLLLFGESAQVGIRFIKAPLEQFPFSKHGSQLPLPGPCTESTAIVRGTGDRRVAAQSPTEREIQRRLSAAGTRPARGDGCCCTSGALPCSGPGERTGKGGRPSCSQLPALLRAIVHPPGQPGFGNTLRSCFGRSGGQTLPDICSQGLFLLEPPQPCRGTRLGLCKLQRSSPSQVFANSCGMWAGTALQAELWGERDGREGIKVMMRGREGCKSWAREAQTNHGLCHAGL